MVNFRPFSPRVCYLVQVQSKSYIDSRLYRPYGFTHFRFQVHSDLDSGQVSDYSAPPLFPLSTLFLSLSEGACVPTKSETSFACQKRQLVLWLFQETEKPAECVNLGSFFVSWIIPFSISHYPYPRAFSLVLRAALAAKKIVLNLSESEPEIVACCGGAKILTREYYR